MCKGLSIPVKLSCVHIQRTNTTLIATTPIDVRSPCWQDNAQASLDEQKESLTRPANSQDSMETTHNIARSPVNFLSQVRADLAIL